MSTTHAARTAADTLRYVLDHWPHLRALLDTTNPVALPAQPDGEHTRTADGHDDLAAAIAHAVSHPQQLVTRHDDQGRIVGYECAHCDHTGDGHAHPVRDDRDPGRLGERPVPLRLHVVDACRAIEDALASLADEVAAAVQRAPITPLRRPNPADPVARDLALLAARDEADPRRWRYNLGDRSAPTAAGWLLARVLDEPGPCGPLPDMWVYRIGQVAVTAANRIDRVIGSGRRTAPMDRPCLWCGSTLVLHDDDSSVIPYVTCTGGPGCPAPVPLDERGRRLWATPQALARLAAGVEAAEEQRRAEQQRARRAADRRRQRAAARQRAA
jgi:hypothetical protein